MKKRISWFLLPLIAIVYSAPVLLSSQTLHVSSVAYAAQTDADGFSTDGGFTPDMNVTQGTPDPKPSDGG